MRVRKVDASGDMVFGRDQAAFWHDVPDGVGQIVESRLNLWEGQWYLDAAEGLSVEQQVLGKRTEATRDPVIRARILDTPGVVEITSYSSVLDRSTRALAVRADIVTSYTRGYVAGSSTNTANIFVKVEDGR